MPSAVLVVEPPKGRHPYEVKKCLVMKMFGRSIETGPRRQTEGRLRECRNRLDGDGFFWAALFSQRWQFLVRRAEKPFDGLPEKLQEEEVMNGMNCAFRSMDKSVHPVFRTIRTNFAF